MATVSFDNLANGDAPEDKSAESTAGGTLATQRDVSGLQGDFSQKDIQLPRINLVQKTSEAVDAGFRPGDVLFKTGDVIIPLQLPSEVTVLNLRKQYQEALPFGSETMPQTFDKAEEVREAGGSLEWGAENYYKQIAHIQLLFPAPDDLSEELRDLFPFSFDGKDYAVGIWTLAGSAYTNGAKPIITAFMSHLRGRHWLGKWTLNSEKKSGNGNTWYVPTFKACGRHDEAFGEFSHGLVANG